ILLTTRTQGILNQAASTALAGRRKLGETEMVTNSDTPLASSAEVHILFNGYVGERVASTVAFVRDGDIHVIIDPGMVPDPGAIFEPLAALGESPAAITDVIFSHHHPDHTLHAALFPNARFHYL